MIVRSWINNLWKHESNSNTSISKNTNHSNHFFIFETMLDNRLLLPTPFISAVLFGDFKFTTIQSMLKNHLISKQRNCSITNEEVNQSNYQH
jgi:hypothetical protein